MRSHFTILPRIGRSRRVLAKTFAFQFWPIGRWPSGCSGTPRPHSRTLITCSRMHVTVAKTTKERWYEAEIHRIAGEIALKLPQLGSSQADAYFERALTVARAEQAKSWELRAAMSMARLCLDQDMRKKARALLAPIYGWFTEGFDTRDLKEAEALLHTLDA